MGISAPSPALSAPPPTKVLIHTKKNGEVCAAGPLQHTRRRSGQWSLDCCVLEYDSCSPTVGQYGTFTHKYDESRSVLNLRLARRNGPHFARLAELLRSTLFLPLAHSTSSLDQAQPRDQTSSARNVDRLRAARH